MIYIVILGALAVAVIAIAAIALRVDWAKYKNSQYYEITLLLGSGGHTG
jgi:hypothetical protein